MLQFDVVILKERGCSTFHTDDCILKIFQYDPGKYYDPKKKQTARDAQESANVGDPAVWLDKASYDHEIEAPWHQYAWAEELRLRVS